MPILPAQIKPLAESLAPLLEDGTEGARTEAASCLGALMKMVGERPLNAVVDGLPDVRKAKVKEAYEKATVKCKSGAGGGPKAPPPPAKKATNSTKVAAEGGEDPPPKKAPSKAPAKPPVSEPS